MSEYNEYVYVCYRFSKNILSYSFFFLYTYVICYPLPIFTRSNYISVWRCLRGLAVACWITDHYHPCSILGVGISEGCFITFGGRSVHLAYHVHKSGRKTSIIIIIFYQCMHNNKHGYIQFKPSNNNYRRAYHHIFKCFIFTDKGLLISFNLKW